MPSRTSINIMYIYLCIIFLVPLYGEGSYRQCLLPNPYCVLYIIKICVLYKISLELYVIEFYLPSTIRFVDIED